MIDKRNDQYSTAVYQHLQPNAVIIVPGNSGFLYATDGMKLTRLSAGSKNFESYRKHLKILSYNYFLPKTSFISLTSLTFIDFFADKNF